jgi:branched-chain amino acid transport system substrate-binding protein
VASHPATGSPVTVGIISVQGQPEFADGVRAAIKYLNAEADGLQGHRVDVKECASPPTAQQDITCANQMVAAHVTAVVLGEDVTADSAFPIYQRAGIPVLSPRGDTNQEFVNPVGLSLGPGVPGVLAAFAGYVRDTLHGHTVAIVSGPVTPDIKAQIDGPMHSAGLVTVYAPFDETNPNFTASFAAAEAKHPSAIALDIDNNSACIPALNALRAVNLKTKVFEILCSDDSVLRAAGSLANGILFYGLLDSIFGVNSPDNQVFHHIMAAYSSTKSTGYNASVAAQAVLTLARVLKHQGGTTVTPHSILTAFHSSKGVSMFMGPPLTCGVVRTFPGMCTAAMRIFTWDTNHKVLLTGYIASPQYLR